MAVNFDAIRAKLAQISEKNKNGDSLWKPKMDTTYHVRLLPFPNNDGQPFKELYFYYGIGMNPGILAPFQFNKKDPFQELSMKLREAGDQASYELSKKIKPSMRAYAAVVVRGEEEAKGPRLWSFGKTVYQNILTYMLDEDYGDVTDVHEGRDFKILISKAAAAQFAKTEVTPRPKSTALADDPRTIKQWMGAIPDVSKIFELKSYEELERIINNWLEADSGKENPPEGTEKGGKSSQPAAKVKPGPQVHDDLDAAFADIISDD